VYFKMVKEKRIIKEIKEKKYLSKPKAQLQTYSGTSVLKQYARESGGLVKEVPNIQKPNINVSMFNKELIKEKKWLLS